MPAIADDRSMTREVPRGRNFQGYWKFWDHLHVRGLAPTAEPPFLPPGTPRGAGPPERGAAGRHAARGLPVGTQHGVVLKALGEPVSGTRTASHTLPAPAHNGECGRLVAAAQALLQSVPSVCQSGGRCFGANPEASTSTVGRFAPRPGRLLEKMVVGAEREAGHLPPGAIGHLNAVRNWDEQHRASRRAYDALDASDALSLFRSYTHGARAYRRL
jgi:hypothetical protein